MPQEMETFYVVRNPDISWTADEQETRIFNFKGEFYTLNETASFIWRNCNGKTTIQSILEKAASYYDREEESIANDILSMLSELEKANLIDFCAVQPGKSQKR